MDEVIKRRLIRCTVAVVLLLSLLSSFYLFTLSHKVVIVTGDSMNPTLCDGDIVSSSEAVVPTLRKVYLLKGPDEDVLVIKRLVGLPGDIIQFKDGALYRNGVLEEEPFKDSWDNAIFKLNDDEYLFVGDNREDSFDGRYWSRFVHWSEVKYQLNFVLYPFSNRGEVR